VNGFRIPVEIKVLLDDVRDYDLLAVGDEFFCKMTTDKSVAAEDRMCFIA
jgi:hypothetical protein